jgi:Protein of unknown function (DUF1036)
MLRNLLANKASLLALALVAAAVVPNVSDASYRRGHYYHPQYLRGQPIYVQNNTARTLSVAAMYQPPGSNGFVSNGFWQVAPGQKLLVATNGNRWIYFYARDNNGQVWAGNDSTTTVNGETLHMAQYDTTMCFDPWTITFGP